MSVVVVAAGGTITSHFDGEQWTNIPVRALVDELGRDFEHVEVVEAALGASSNLDTVDMLRIVESVGCAFDDGATGVVVVHGTDTMELTAYVTHLFDPARGRGPVVFTGSMRVHSHHAPDGPDNLRNAVTIASVWNPDDARVVVCLEGVIHSAPAVRKRTAVSVDAFDSFPLGPVGRVSANGEIVVVRAGSTPGDRATALAGPVPLLACYPGISADVVESALVDARGIVVEGFGDLNVPDAVWGPIHRAWRRGLLVVLASGVFTTTSTSDTMSLFGGVGAGGLTAQKARLLAMAALGSTSNRDAAVEFFRSHAVAFHDPERSTS